MSTTRAQVLRLAVPVMLANVGVSLSGIADTAVMGRMGDPVLLSATAIAATFFSTLFWAFGFLRMSTGGLVAQAFGADDVPEQRRALLRATLLATGIGVAFLLLQRPLLALGLAAIDSGPTLERLIGDYVGIRVLSAPALLALFAVHGALVGRQSMRALLVLQLLQTGLNVLLNALFFGYTDLGIRGVATATVLADYCALGVGLALLSAPLRLRASATGEALFDRVALRRLLSISGHLFVRSLFLTAAYFWLMAAGTRLGVVVVAANAILLLFATFSAHLLDGFAHASEALVGQAIGARDRADLHRAIRLGAELGLLAGVLLTVAYAIGGPAIIDALTTDAGTRMATREWLPWAIVLPLAGVGSFLLDGIFIGATEARAMRDTVIVAFVIFVLATIWWTPPFGNHGLWAAYAAMLIVRAVGLALLLPRLLRRAIADR